MTFSVRLASSAQQDVQSILRWIEARSRTGSEAWYRTWMDVLGKLAARGDAFAASPEDADHEETIRQAIFRTRRGLPYRALFVVRGEEVYVLRVRGPGQDYVQKNEIGLPE